MCIGHKRRPSGLRRAASAGRRAGAQPAVQPQSASAAISSAMQLPSSQVAIPASYVFTEDIAANGVVAPSELPTAQAARSMPVQPVATTKPPVLPDASMSAGQQAAVKQKAVGSELSDEASDKALRVPQGVAGAPLPRGICTSGGQGWPLHMLVPTALLLPSWSQCMHC